MTFSETLHILLTPQAYPCTPDTSHSSQPPVPRGIGDRSELIREGFGQKSEDRSHLAYDFMHNPYSMIECREA